MIGARNWWLAAGVSSVVCVIGWAAPPLPLEKVVSAEDLVAEAAAKGAEIESALASAESYKDAADKVRQSASLLAIIGQAVTEHPQDSALKKAGPSIRDAARGVAAAKEYADVKAAFPKLQAALKGEVNSEAPAEFNWAKLSRMHPAMEEMNNRGTQLRRLLRRPKDPAVDSRHASMIALLAVSAHADTHEVKNEADLPKWHGWAKELQEKMSEAATKIKAKDTAGANAAFIAGQETCNKCHEVFQEH